MDIIQVTGENAEDYYDYLGPDLSEDMSRSFFRGLAAVDDAGCHGILIYELLGVDDGDVRSRICLLTADNDEIKGRLIDEYTEAASEEKVKKSFYETPEEDMASFFEKVGFSNESVESKALSFTVADLAKLPFHSKGRFPNYIKSLKDTSIIQYRNFVKRVIVKGEKGGVDDLAYLPISWFEREASSCSVSDDKIDGIFLIRKMPSGEIRPQLYIAFGPNSVKTLGFMLANSVNYVVEHYPPDTKVVVYRRNKAVMAMTQKLLPGYKGEDIFVGNRIEEDAKNANFDAKKLNSQ